MKVSFEKGLGVSAGGVRTSRIQDYIEHLLRLRMQQYPTGITQSRWNYSERSAKRTSRASVLRHRCRI